MCVQADFVQGYLSQKNYLLHRASPLLKGYAFKHKNRLSQNPCVLANAVIVSLGVRLREKKVSPKAKG